MQKRHYYILLLFMSAALAVTGFFSLHLGTVPVPVSATLSGFLPDAQNSFSGAELETFKTVVMQIRLPRLLAAVLCGAALAVSGVTYQSMFLNPLVSPDLLGVLAGSAFGASLGLLFGKSLLTAHLFAFIAGIIAVGFAVFLARLFPGNRLIMLIMG
ncbi:MAG TPA: iron chelate uptake ABC transporter family permease subunit, partial [Candidatus Rifleibacterium sp.]|nr:iron chelate uptake ABC transporter family permease subunit [Candidatus Rifleibacterium sp.]